MPENVVVVVIIVLLPMSTVNISRVVEMLSGLRFDELLVDNLET